jgi:hypothetical protein
MQLLPHVVSCSVSRVAVMREASVSDPPDMPTSFVDALHVRLHVGSRSSRSLTATVMTVTRHGRRPTDRQVIEFDLKVPPLDCWVHDRLGVFVCLGAPQLTQGY